MSMAWLQLGICIACEIQVPWGWRCLVNAYLYFLSVRIFVDPRYFAIVDHTPK